VPLSWPARHCHSPVETIDLRDVRALADLVQAVLVAP
jgi:putative aminopeptidase FrvX